MFCFFCSTIFQIQRCTTNEQWVKIFFIIWCWIEGKKKKKKITEKKFERKKEGEKEMKAQFCFSIYRLDVSFFFFLFCSFFWNFLLTKYYIYPPHKEMLQHTNICKKKGATYVFLPFPPLPRPSVVRDSFTFRVLNLCSIWITWDFRSAQKNIEWKDN